MASTYPLIIYSNNNYGGSSANVTYGNFSDLKSFGMTQVLSVKVAAFTRLTAYTNAGFGGSYTDIYGPIQIPDLRVYNGGTKLLSLMVNRVEPVNSVKLGCCSGTSSAFSCGEFTPGGQACNTFLGNFCAVPSNIANQQCQQWCRSNTAACDNSVLAFCKTNPGHPYCTCINSPANTRNIVNARCVDKACINSGYITTTMSQTSCPAIVTCEVNLDLRNSGVSIGSTVPIEQNCGNTTIVDTSGRTITSQPNPGRTVQVQTIQSPPPQIVVPAVFWIFLMFVVSTILFVILLVRRRRQLAAQQIHTAPYYPQQQFANIRQ